MKVLCHIIQEDDCNRYLLLRADTVTGSFSGATMDENGSYISWYNRVHSNEVLGKLVRIQGKENLRLCTMGVLIELGYL